MLGAAFKPDSDDIRDSPALNVAAQASLQGADVVVTDPAAIDNARKTWPDLSYAATAEEAVTGADVVLLLTEWPEYTGLDPAPSAGSPAPDASSTAATPSTRDWRAAGWTYRGLGRRGNGPRILHAA